MSFQSQARLLDKILAIVNDQVITLSDIQRIQKTVSSRRNIIPQIYHKKKPSYKDIVKIKVERIIIREKLKEVGSSVSDKEVEQNIKYREKSLGINRKALISFLKNNKLTFREYFEITREAIEFNRFNHWIIQPLISITDQEIKNVFYEKNRNNKTLSFSYQLVGYSLPKSKLKKKSMIRNFRKVLKKYHKTGNFPSSHASVKKNNLGKMNEGGLSRKLTRLLKSTEEGNFTKPILIGKRYHVFYLEKKDLVESEFFKRKKEKIRNELIQKESKKMISFWFNSEKSKHYIKYFL